MKKIIAVVLILAMLFTIGACGRKKEDPSVNDYELSMHEQKEEIETGQDEDPDPASNGNVSESKDMVSESVTESEEVTEETADVQKEESLPAVSVVDWDNSWQYADCSVLHSDSVTLYRAVSGERKNVVVTVNAGHGTSGGTSVKTLCHPDGSPKVTGGSTEQGAVKATAVSTGTTMLDGTPEAKVTLSLALLVKDTLLNNGYDVLMIRETEDAQIDNVARTVYANNNSDCHIALHYNSTDSDAGFFYIAVPNIDSYKAMEPVASHWQEHNAFGAALLEGMKEQNVKICGDGFMGMDLTQTSYSTVPSTDIEVGDRGSDYSQETQQKIADGILAGLNIWCEQRQ